MSATNVLSSAKRKKTKPHKLGEKKRLFSSSDEEEIVLPRQETPRDSSEENLSGPEYSPAQLTGGGDSTPLRRGRAKGRKNKTTSSSVTTSKESCEESQRKPTNTPTASASAPQKSPSAGDGTPRGRGRPKGSKSKSFTGSHIMVFRARNGQDHRNVHRTTAFPIREHPPGGDAPHRGRGRPKGSTKKIFPVSIQVTGQSTGENTPKRSRGRPKGSPNKKPSKAALMVKYGIPKLGRGRPKKLRTSNGAVVPKRGRGRPKGGLNKSPSAKKMDVSTGGSGLKRGRPKKDVSHDTTPLTIKRPRGRPKLTDTEVGDSGSNMENQDSFSGYDSSP